LYSPDTGKTRFTITDTIFHIPGPVKPVESVLGAKPHKTILILENTCSSLRGFAIHNQEIIKTSINGTNFWVKDFLIKDSLNAEEMH